MTIIECNQCGEQHDLTGQDPVSITCNGCQQEILHLGAMPVPLAWLPESCDLFIWRNQNLPAEVSLEDLPKKICPWCGTNVGVRKECKECESDLNVIGKLLLKEYAASLDLRQEDLAAFKLNATGPIAVEAKLASLKRLTRQQGIAVGGRKAGKFAEQLPEQLTTPPGYAGAATESSGGTAEKKWWQFWK